MMKKEELDVPSLNGSKVVCHGPSHLYIYSIEKKFIVKKMKEHDGNILYLTVDNRCIFC